MNIRPLTAADKEWLDKSIEEDQWHKEAGLTADYWIDGGAHSLVYEAENGSPLVVLKATPFVQIDLHFCSDRLANARAFVKGAPALMKLMKDKGYAGIIAQPLSPRVEKLLLKYQFQPLNEYRFRFPRDLDEQANK